MRLRLLLFFIFILNGAIVNSQHPIAYLNTNEASFIKTAVNKYPLLKQSYQDTKNEVDRWLSGCFFNVGFSLAYFSKIFFTKDAYRASFVNW